MKTNTFSLALALLCGALLCNGVAQAATQVFVNEDFESYADTSSVLSAWTERQGATNYTLIDQTYSTFISNAIGAPEYPLGQKAFDPTSTGATGKGLEFVGAGALEIDLSTLNNGNSVKPTAEQSVVVRGDIFDVNANANKRRSIGLRNTNYGVDPAVTVNLLEMGFYNTLPVVAGLPTDGFAARAVIFEGAGVEPNWFALALDPALDGADADTVVRNNDIGEAWHTYEMVITPTTVTFSIDLYRDGKNNVTDAEGVIDYTVTFADLNTSAIGYNQVRFGGPSGLTSQGQNGYGGVVFDNLYVALEDAVVVPEPLVGDFNSDGSVNAADYTVWRDTLDSTTDLRADANGNDVVDNDDYPFWANNYGATSAPAASVTIPEPTSLVLVVLGLVGAARRRA